VACETIGWVGLPVRFFTFFTFFFQNPKKTWLFTFFWVASHVFSNTGSKAVVDVDTSLERLDLASLWYCDSDNDYADVTICFSLMLQSQREACCRVPAEAWRHAGWRHFRFLSVLRRGVRKSAGRRVSERRSDHAGVCDQLPVRAQGVFAVSRMVE